MVIRWSGHIPWWEGSLEEKEGFFFSTTNSRKNKIWFRLGPPKSPQKVWRQVPWTWRFPGPLCLPCLPSDAGITPPRFPGSASHWTHLSCSAASLHVGPCIVPTPPHLTALLGTAPIPIRLITVGFWGDVYLSSWWLSLNWWLAKSDQECGASQRLILTGIGSW